MGKVDNTRENILTLVKSELKMFDETIHNPMSGRTDVLQAAARAEYAEHVVRYFEDEEYFNEFWGLHEHRTDIENRLEANKDNPLELLKMLFEGMGGND